MRGLTADRIGDAVDLSWTTPAKSTDGVSLAGKHGAGALMAEICRNETASLTPCTDPTRVAVLPGAPAVFHDVLPPALAGGALRVLRYQVRVLNGRGKGAKYVLAETLAGAAPPVVRGLNAAPVLNGVTLRWQPDIAADGTRTVLRVERGHPAGAAQPHPDLLAVEAAAHDPGGATDTGAKAGVEQRYAVVRTRTMRSDGKDLSASSLPARITVSAAAKAAPPGPPAGLEALVNTLGTPEIDLVWQPVDGAAGYVVFRAAGDGVSARITPQPITGLSYADSAVRIGVRYRYSIVSVDASGAGGAPGPDLIESIPQP